MATPKQKLKEEGELPTPVNLLEFLTPETRKMAIGILESGIFEGLGLSNRSIRILGEKREEALIIINGGNSELTDEENKKVFILCKQTSGLVYIAHQNDEEQRTQYLTEYQKFSSLSGRKEANSLNTLVKMGANKETLIDDAIKVGYSEFVINKFRKMDDTKLDNARIEERRTGIENMELAARTPVRAEITLSLEEQEENVEKFSSKIHSKKAKLES